MVSLLNAISTIVGYLMPKLTLEMNTSATVKSIARVKYLIVLWLIVSFFFLHLFSKIGNYSFSSHKHTHTDIRGSLNKFPDFFVLALLLIVHTRNSSPLRTNLLRLKYPFCTVSFWKAPWKYSCVSMSITFVTASFISSIVS